MIINATTGTGFLGALSYIHKKHEKNFTEEQKPIILDENMVFGSVAEQAYLMKSIAIRNARSSRPILHLSVSFHKDEIINPTTRDLIFDKILEEIGATRYNNQFVIAQHFDAEHEHYHILINKVGFDRRNINTSYIINKCQVIADKIEIELDLRKTVGRTIIYDPDNEKGFRYTTQEERRDKKVFLDKSTGIKEAKEHIRNTIDHFMQQTYTVQDLIIKLDEHGIDCNATFDKNKILKGISFKYKNQAYKGTQLGLKSKEIENFYSQKRELEVIKTYQSLQDLQKQQKFENSPHQIYKKDHTKLTVDIKNLEHLRNCYRLATQQIVSEIVGGEKDNIYLYNKVRDFGFSINESKFSFGNYSFKDEILKSWISKSIVDVKTLREEYKERVEEYTQLINQASKKISIFMLPNKRKAIAAENEELKAKKEMSKMPVLDMSLINIEFSLLHQMNQYLKQLQSSLLDLEKKEKLRLEKIRRDVYDKKSKEPLSKEHTSLYMKHRGSYNNSEHYKNEFLSNYEHNDAFIDLFWLDKVFSGIENENEKIHFLINHFGINSIEAQELSNKFYDFDRIVILKKISIINELPDRIIRYFEEEKNNDQNINRGFNMR